MSLNLTSSRFRPSSAFSILRFLLFMWLAQLLLLFAIESVGPGLFIVRRWRLSPSEKLVISVGVSYFLVYLGSFAIFAAGLNSRWQLLVTLTCLLLTIASFRDFLRLVSNRQVRRMLLGYLGLAAWACSCFHL